MQDKFLQFLGLTKRAGKLIEGYNKCEEIIDKRKIHLILISLDCSENTKKKFISYCSKYNVPYIENYSKETLGASLGREEVNILGVADKNMSLQLLKLYNNL
jgi:ribosomal protein L7Ae-like RNA K-turn-binding protein